jgi:hypothetical protein
MFGKPNLIWKRDHKKREKINVFDFKSYQNPVLITPFFIKENN